MKIYERGNASKQGIFLELQARALQRPLRILDLACGDGRLWSVFLPMHPHVSVVGIDTDASAIQRGQARQQERLELRVFDAQHPLKDELFDVVVAFSAIEHVVDRSAFLRTVWGALASGGWAYLNYDVGHFRSPDLKERLMVPVSQFLAYIGLEGSYMKRVDDALFLEQARTQGFVVQKVRKHNLHPLKGFFRGATDEAVKEWFVFEERLNDLYSARELDEVMWSTTVILQKP
jgi:SAM-dependent methyltransferase